MVCGEKKLIELYVLGENWERTLDIPQLQESAHTVLCAQFNISTSREEREHADLARESEEAKKAKRKVKGKCKKINKNARIHLSQVH